MTERYCHQRSGAECACVCVSTISHDPFRRKEALSGHISDPSCGRSPALPGQPSGGQHRQTAAPTSVHPFVGCHLNNSFIFKARGEKQQLMSRINIILLYLSFVQCNYNTNM